MLLSNGEKSKDNKSGDQADHSIKPLLPIHSLVKGLLKDQHNVAVLHILLKTKPINMQNSESSIIYLMKGLIASLEVYLNRRHQLHFED